MEEHFSPSLMHSVKWFGGFATSEEDRNVSDSKCLTRSPRNSAERLQLGTNKKKACCFLSCFAWETPTRFYVVINFKKAAPTFIDTLRSRLPFKKKRRRTWARGNELCYKCKHSKSPAMRRRNSCVPFGEDVLPCEIIGAHNSCRPDRLSWRVLFRLHLNAPIVCKFICCSSDSAADARLTFRGD
ncbi:hypothetical protein CEXT_675001 [Caerostris extrusa]|uniref:Uncharacterized protein n=1 Tax=Caerostris extrusa TaxID=172846 RepID=A0AAV4S633_CAEEX|nr:hypothetical protein CEXT_675001 [Caerostris extrusa]